jgi:UDP-hydrolysing UDP-N-acetyl-D-glucosamine 2-epimerase
MIKLKESKKLKLKIVVTGMHLLKEYGETYKIIEKDKFKIDLRIHSKQKGTEASNVLNGISKQIEQCNKFVKLKPDAVVLLGDRYDIYPFALICHLYRIPIIHLHGGETTSGAIDDQIRDSISLFSTTHFVAHKIFSNKLLKLGISRKNIFNYGTIGLENIKDVRKLNKHDILVRLGLNIFSKYILVCVHPETASNNIKSTITSILNSLGEFKDYGIIFTGVNSDTDSSFIKSSILSYVKKNNRCRYIESAGRELYINILRNASVIIGNSSSGVIEAPYLKIPTVNVGKRQDGRPMASSVISIDADKDKIIKSIRKAILGKSVKKYENIYYKANKSSERMIKKIEELLSK